MYMYMCIHVCSTARMQLLPVLDFSSSTIYVSNIVCILIVVGDGVQGAVMYTCIHTHASECSSY